MGTIEQQQDEHGCQICQHQVGHDAIGIIGIDYLSQI